MATSGTTGFNPDFGEIFEEAAARAGVPILSGDDYRSAMRSFNLLMNDWANRGLNFWTIDDDTSLTMVAGTGEYTLPSNALDVFDAQWRTGTGTSQQDLHMTRMSRADYLGIANKNQTGIPLQYMVQRNVTSSTITLWPTPNEANTLVLQIITRIEDGGARGDYTPDVPVRFLHALCSDLAYQIALKKQAPLDRLQWLKQEAREDWTRAWEEDRDKSSWYIRPSTRGYRVL